MKTFTLLLSFLFVIIFNLKAQIPNKGFENWKTTENYEEPVGWATTNPYSTTSFYSVTKSTDHYPISEGNYSVRIENNIEILYGLGIIMPDALTSPRPKFPISGHPNSLTGYFKFFPINGDTMYIQINLFIL